MQFIPRCIAYFEPFVDCLYSGNGSVCNWWHVCLVPILLRSPMTVSRGLRLGGTPPLEWSVAVIGTLWFLASPLLLPLSHPVPPPSPPLPPPSSPPPTRRCAGRHEHSNRSGSHHTWNVLFRYGCWIRVRSQFQQGVTCKKCSVRAGFCC